jgi:excisionase family DNA binding protein
VTEPSDFVSAREAAERLGVTKNTVIHWLVRDVLHGTQEAYGGRWRIPESEVDRVARARAKGRL